MKPETLSFVVVVSLAISSPLSGAQTSNADELSLRKQAEEKISLGDYEGAETILAQLKSVGVARVKPPAKPSPSPVPEKPKEITLFDRMKDAGFVLQRAAGNPGDADPAQFSFLRDFRSDITTYTADFFLSFSPNRIRDSETNRFVQPSYHPFGLATDLKVEASVEAKLTSDVSAVTNDALRFRLSGTFDTSSVGGLFDSTYTTFSFKSESDQKFDFTRLSAEIWFTPTKTDFALGRYQPQPASDYPIQFRWRPYLGVDLGGTVSSPRPVQEMSDQRLIFRTTGSILFPSLAKSLRFYEISLFADNYVYYLIEDGSGHDYVTAGASFLFNENIGFKLTLKLGQDAPQFKYEETLGGALSVKF